MKRTKVSRFLCALLCAIMIVSLFAPCVQATGTDGTAELGQADTGQTASQTGTSPTTPSDPTDSSQEAANPPDGDSSTNGSQTEPPAPTESTPAESSPTEPIPTESTPAESIPTESTPTEDKPATNNGSIPGKLDTSIVPTIPNKNNSLTTINPSLQNSLQSTDVLTTADDGIATAAETAKYTVTVLGECYRPNANKTFYYTCPYGYHGFEMIQFRRVHIGTARYPGYCINPGQPAVNSTYTGVEASAEDSWNYYLSENLTAAQQRAIGLALLYGYPNKHNPSAIGDRAASEIATQIIIWEFILGFRSTTPPYTCSKYGLINSYTGTGDYNGYAVTKTRDYYDQIEEDLANHAKVPSFADARSSYASTYTMSPTSDGKYSVTLTDTNNMLSHYTFTNTDTMTFSVSGNQLTITSTVPLSSTTTISPKKYVPDLTKASFLVLHTGGTQQTNVCMTTSVTDDPVPAYFKLKTSGGTVAITKTTSTGTDLSGWTMSLKSGSTTVVSGQTNASGKLTFSDVAPGTYTLVETVPSTSNYKCTNNNQTVTVTLGQTTSVTVNNDLKTGKIRVNKTTNTGTDKNGWTFGVYSDKNCTTRVTTMTTNANGVATSGNINVGTYYIKEITTRNGWQNDTSVKSITVKGDTTTTLSYTFTNTRLYGNISATKTTNTGANLDGWEFGIYSDANCTNLISTMTTNSSGVATSGDLELGTVYVKELSTRDNWITDTSVKSVTVEAGKTVSAGSFYNQHNGLCQITKKTNTGANLGNWTFRIYSNSSCTDTVATLTTNANGKTDTISIAPGTYYFKEIGDTQGRFGSEYWPDETTVQSFTVTAGQTAYIEWTNNHYGKIEITKNTNTGTNRNNWEFVLYSDSACTTEVGRYKTGADGKIKTGILAPGTYYLKEVARNDPYWVSDTAVKTVAVTAGQTTPVAISNTHRGLAKVTKKTNTGDNLDGWLFGFYADQACTQLKGTITSNSTGNGSVYLEPGTYWAKEINFNGRTDEYWNFDSEVKQITITAGQDTEIEFTNIHNGKVLIKKSMATDGPVADWEFKITRLSDNADMGIYKTGADGTILTTKLLPGQYKVEEIFPGNSYYYCKTENPVTVTVTEGQTTEVPFTNALRPGRIEIKKVDPFGNTLSGVKFALEWSKDGSTWTPVTYSDKEDVILGGCSTSGLAADGSLRTDSTGIVAFENLYPLLQYRVTELETVNGYLLLSDYAFVGDLPIENLEVVLEVTNSPGFKLPSTGSEGTDLLVILGAATVALAMTLLVVTALIPHSALASRGATNIKNNKKGRK